MEREESSDCQIEEAYVELVCTCYFSRWNSTAFNWVSVILDAAGRCTYDTSYGLYREQQQLQNLREAHAPLPIRVSTVFSATQKLTTN